jgi:hypothetical protein
VVVRPVLTNGDPVTGVIVSVYDVAWLAAVQVNRGLLVVQPPFVGVDKVAFPTANAKGTPATKQELRKPNPTTV